MWPYHIMSGNTFPLKKWSAIHVEYIQLFSSILQGYIFLMLLLLRFFQLSLCTIWCLMREYTLELRWDTLIVQWQGACLSHPNISFYFNALIRKLKYICICSQNQNSYYIIWWNKKVRLIVILSPLLFPS